MPINRVKQRAANERWRKHHPDKAKDASRRYYWKNRRRVLRKSRARRRDPFKRQHDADVQWKSRLKKLYGMTPDAYEALLHKQHGLCAVCRKPSYRRLDVDHSHQTGKVRGLLCPRCNRGVGWFDDSPRLLQRLVKYLESYQ